MANIKYEDITIEECISIYKKSIACICDGDNKEIHFEENLWRR